MNDKIDYANVIISLSIIFLLIGGIIIMTFIGVRIFGNNKFIDNNFISKGYVQILCPSNITDNNIIEANNRLFTKPRNIPKYCIKALEE